MTEQPYISHDMTDPATLPPDALIPGEITAAYGHVMAALGSVSQALEQAKKAGDLRRGDALIVVQSRLLVLAVDLRELR